MSDVVVSVVESETNVVVSEQDVAVDVTENVVQVSVSTAGIQGAPGANNDPTYVTVRNATGATLAKGTIVYISGANGNNVQVTPAIATSDATSARTLGWLAVSIPNNGSGLCMVEGYLEGLNTQSFNAGDQLYLSGSVAGAFTATKPQAPIHLVYVGVVTKKSAGDGHVFVKVQNGYELGELHDVQIISPTNNQVLAYDSATQLWKNAVNAPDGVTSITAVSPLTGGTITSTGSIGLNQALLSITKSQVSDFTSGTVTSASTAQQAGTAVYSVNSGTAVYATTSGTAVYSVNSGTAVNLSGSITKSQVSDFTSGTVASAGTAQQSGTAVFANTSGTATYATTSGTAVSISGDITKSQVSDFTSGTVASASTAQQSGTAVFALTSGTATYATNAGTAVFATNAGTAVGVSGSAITQSQVVNLTTDLAGKANLAGGNALTGAQTITSTAIGQVPLTLVGASGQTANLLSTAGGARIPAAGNYFIAPGLTSTFVADFNAGNTTTTPVTVAGSSGHSVDLQRWVVAGTTRASVNSTGSMLLGNTSIAADSYISFIGAGSNRNTGLRWGADAAGSDWFTLLGNTTDGDLTLNILGASRSFNIRGAASQSANLLELQNSASDILARFSSAGSLIISNTAAASALLSITGAGGGVMSVSQTGAISTNAGLTVNGGTSALGGFHSSSATPVLVVGATNQVADLQIWRTLAGTTLGGRNANAQIFTGSTAPIQTAVGGGTSAATGTGSVATISTVNAHNLANGDRVTIAGMTPTGYNGTYIISGVSTFSFNIANATTGSQTVAGTVSVDSQASVTSRSAATTPLILRGAASQSSNLFEVQRADAGVAFRVRNNGNFGSGGLLTGTNAYINNDIIGNTIGLIIRGASGQTSSLQQWQNNSGGLVATMSAAGDLAVYGNGITSGDHRIGTATYLNAALNVQARAATEIGTVIRGFASQTADALQIQTSDGTTQARFSPIGYLQVGAGANPGGQLGIPIGAAANRGIVIQAAASQSADLVQVLNSAAGVIARIQSNGVINGAEVRTNSTQLVMREVAGGGNLYMARATSLPSNPGANIGTLYFRDGTNAGTLRLCVRAGAAGAETTILDNIPQ
jgi:hypothetical protein